MIKQTEKGIILEARVKAGSGPFSIASDGNVIIIHTKSPAEGNKANLEIVKELSRLFGKDVRIIRGLKGRKKEIFVQASREEVEKALHMH